MKKALLTLTAFAFTQMVHAKSVDHSRNIFSSIVNAFEWTLTSEDGHTIYKKTIGGLTCTRDDRGQNTCEIDVLHKDAKVIYDSLFVFEQTTYLSSKLQYVRKYKYVGNLTCTLDVISFNKTVTETADCYLTDYP